MNTRRAGAPRWPSALDAAFGAAVAIKLADGGAWETATTVPLHAVSRASDLDAWLTCAGHDIAFEVAFDSNAFVGARLRPVERTHAIATLHALLDRLGPPGHDGRPTRPCATDVLKAIDATLTTRFNQRHPSQAELGVLDRWRSLGAVHMSEPPWQSLEVIVGRHPLGELLRTRSLPAPLMLEVVYGSQSDAWLALPVAVDPDSTRSATQGVRGTDLDALADLLWHAHVTPRQ